MTQTIQATPNRFQGIEIDSEGLPADPESFRHALTPTLQDWRQAGYKLAWLHVPITRAALIPVAVDAGFFFHHSQESYTMLVNRLDPDALVPGYATHYIGIGGVVVNEKSELLVVSEKHRRDMSRPYWKLPGGALHSQEHLAEAVVREVFEETGVQAKFEHVACFRHWHNYRYGKSDIYFVARLSALSSEITPEEGEIEDSLWMPVEQYMASEYVGDFNKRIVRAALEWEGIHTTWVDGYDDPTTREFFFPMMDQ